MLKKKNNTLFNLQKPPSSFQALLSNPEEVIIYFFVTLLTVK